MLKLSPSDRFLSLTLAGRFLWSASDALSNVGRLAFLGLVLSITVLVTVTSIVNGFERELQQRVLALAPSLEVQIQGGLDAASERNLQDTLFPYLDCSFKMLILPYFSASS